MSCASTLSHEHCLVLCPCGLAVAVLRKHPFTRTLPGAVSLWPGCRCPAQAPFHTITAWWCVSVACVSYATLGKVVWCSLSPPPAGGSILTHATPPIAPRSLCVWLCVHPWLPTHRCTCLPPFSCFGSPFARGGVSSARAPSTTQCTAKSSKTRGTTKCGRQLCR